MGCTVEVGAMRNNQFQAKRSNRCIRTEVSISTHTHLIIYLFVFSSALNKLRFSISKILIIDCIDFAFALRRIKSIDRSVDGSQCGRACCLQ